MNKHVKKILTIIFKIFLYGILIPLSILNWVFFLQLIFYPELETIQSFFHIFKIVL